mmetsp:Transcript_7205/g.8650  ORF Transcript_7205/g.8650 Transcript_7205/m.8650 type:complete len:124 (+) Transcript_7205:1267-1638(+)
MARMSDISNVTLGNQVAALTGNQANSAIKKSPFLLREELLKSATSGVSSSFAAKKSARYESAMQDYDEIEQSQQVEVVQPNPFTTEREGSLPKRHRQVSDDDDHFEDESCQFGPAIGGGSMQR